ncbi:hypothetical protein GCM10009789_83200 [Kribbella sancticallisti]|uniref:Uncharacterized protein n=1 Tax=Kribbella sancticallisti TaxID=460087 RepID=A0ABP4QMV6_9ACTN
MAQADISLVPEPGAKNYDAMTSAELKEAGQRWVLDYIERHRRQPTQQEVGDEHGKSRGWGRDLMKEMRMRGLIADDGTGETVDTLAELTADVERAEAEREQALNAQRAAEANAARIQERAERTVAEVRAEADRRVAALEGALTERLSGSERQSMATVQRLQAEHEQQIRQIRQEADEQVQRAQREAAAATEEATRRLAGLEGASAERVRLSEQQAAAETARLQAEHEQQLAELQQKADARLDEARRETDRVRAEAEVRVAEAIENAPTVRRAAEDEARTEVLAATITSAHHTWLQGLMYGFYGVAAAAALTGQVWAGVEHIPFPASWPIGWKIAVVAPAFAVVEFGGVVTAYAADLRRRLGERATGFRMMSFGAATVAAGFNLVGHWGQWFPAIGFTGLSVFAFVLWLLYSEARRRDVLRDAGMMSRPAPVYGIGQWLRDFKLTWQARRLAVEFGYGTYESLRHAKELNAAEAAERQAELEAEEAAERRRARLKAIGDAIVARIVDRSEDPIGAEIAKNTIDLDRVAAEAEQRVSYDGWGELIAQDLDPYRQKPDTDPKSVTA